LLAGVPAAGTRSSFLSSFRHFMLDNRAYFCYTIFTMEKDKEQTNVIFRKYRDGDVIALMPEILGDMSPATCQSYMHVGQHGAANPLYVIGDTRPAAPAEYADLHKELEGIGYNVKIIQRYRHKFTEKRIAELSDLMN
jgi:hypothetical protein